MQNDKLKSKIVVLGIHDGHNAGAALVKNGKVVAAISEERLNNIKNYFGPPLLSIKKVYEIAKISPEETDLIAIGCLVRVGPPYANINWLGKIQVQLAPFFHGHFFAKTYVKLLHLFREVKGLKTFFSNFGLGEKPLIFVEHHLSHAACAYYQRPWKGEALVLTLDGSGDGLSATVSAGKDYKIERIAETTFYDSLSNNLYSEITGYLGMKRWEHEYKVMGLAPYGKDDGLIEELRKIIRINPKKPLEFQNTFGVYLWQVTEKLSKALMGRRFDNIAWANQRYFEELIAQWVKNAIKYTGIHNIVCSGGAFLNVKANKILRELPEVDKAFFYPAADDGGTPVGAALAGYVGLCQEKKIKPKIYPLADIYYGKKFTNEEIEEIIKKTKWGRKAELVKTGLEKEIARLLNKGKIVGRFAGRDEWGPRALGNRSILADPRDLKVINKLNFAIKQRDFWMPFAPSLLEEEAKNYLVDFHPARYMIEAFDTKEKAQGIIATLHQFDKTCRPQTVNFWNLSYRKIIEEFQKLTGVSGILNTSFNLHGFPIVGSPATALFTFENSGLDVLILENWVIEK
ncbi:MAG: carbamoyltransferase C-terminal domain-containing protein [Candidatus Pacearchaeota archaeon]